MRGFGLIRTLGCVAGLCLPIAGCSDDGAPAGGSDTTGSTSSDAQTTLPVTSISITDTADPGTSGDDSDPSGTSTGGSSAESSDTDTDTSTATGTGGDTDTGGSSTGQADTGGTTGTTSYVVEWCILQFPAEIMEAPEVPTEVYGRVYVEGITDQTVFVDEDPAVVAEFGYGADGSDPAGGDWTWVAGQPNPGWDGSMAPRFGSENNDEYLAELSFPEAGVYDYAARFSADGGATWVYCDLDDLENGGYTPDQAGNAVIE